MTEIKRENLNYGVNVEPLLDELSQCEVGNISNGEFEVEGENEGGCSGFCTVEIPKLAGDALKVIAALEEQVRALAVDGSVLKNAIEQCKEFFKAWVLNRISPYNGAYLNALCAHATEETPATDAALREVRAQARAEGIHFAANRLLAAWESGFVDDTPAEVHDISSAILSAVEFLPNADEAEFKRDYADEVRARIRAGEQP